MMKRPFAVQFLKNSSVFSLMDQWNSRRSAVLSRSAICSSSQPLASSAGAKILMNGGTAADAAVAMAAALNVLEPCSTGIGGDAFALYYEASTKKVHCLMGNGPSSCNYSLEMLAARGIGFGENMKPLDPRSGLCVTVPGAAGLWEDLVSYFGKLSLGEVLQPAIELADEGFPVSPITAQHWEGGFLQGEEANRILRPGGRAPRPGELFFNHDLAHTFQTLANCGAKEGFYKGAIADAIIDAVAEFGGVLTHEDLEAYTTEFEDPISVVYKGKRIYETPPPTHGVAALIALALIEELTPPLMRHWNAGEAVERDSRGSAEDAHVAIECMRLAYSDALQYICDPRVSQVPIKSLLNPEIIARRAQLISKSATTPVQDSDFSAFSVSDTVYFCCVDSDGNACSMINSNYMGFGTGIVPKGTGFTLHNRGYNFSLEPGHPNVAAPRKRPYHTIIPGLATNESDGSLYCVFGNMGGFMQPMGHVQLMRNLLDFGMDPQAALDAPRWYVVGPGQSQSSRDVYHSEVLLEDGYGGRFDGGSEEGSEQREDVKAALERKGHVVGPYICGEKRSLYGRGQIIVRDRDSGVLWGGSDPRADGCAIPLL